MNQSSRVLATRCPHCHTVFRVVGDQLKLRDGLVRCGHCHEVFDGRAYLCEPPNDEAGSPAAGIQPAAEVARNTPASVANAVDAGNLAQTADATPAPAVASRTADNTDTSVASTQGASSGGEKRPIPEMLTPTAIAALLGTPDESRAQMQHGPGRYLDDDPAALDAPTSAPAHTTAQTSSGSAERAGRPRAARVVWRVLLTLTIVGLLAQWAWLERAGLVDRIPALRGVFAAVGRPLHVTVAPPRQPDMIQISSVTLVTDEPGASDAMVGATADTASGVSVASDVSSSPGDTVPMTLTVFIRNQADYTLAWPSLELTLSDIDGKPVVRRVFGADDYVTDASLRDAGMAPRNERTIRLRLSAQAALASNYRVLAFYP
ncbi:DUF3426 domain-containing protein [Pandoraea pulmonicola]|uniref:MJ0042 family finger-like domain n=1 Tax=Pandoraea pulmonicola TaxID=93221 RepID=A0AAJ4ZDY4_PANPU|nr:DUF3426 domain-containing protein [Pandoraea pulmonicola]AJC20045.1 hypothetical protein RO07_05395 [Pandoraea pulmonicola]SUA91679.1 MJ0042 family finger-like domain [Pandoraea pulmonicola]